MSTQAPAPPSGCDGIGLTLFVGGSHASSVRATEVLRDALQAHPGLAELLRVIDVFDESRAALEAGVVATPSLLAADGDRRLWMIGEFEDREELDAFLHGFSERLGGRAPPRPGSPDETRESGG